MDKIKYIKEKIIQANPTKQWEWDCKCGMTHDKDYSLADVLLAIQNRGEVFKNYHIATSGHFYSVMIDHRTLVQAYKWDLFKDSLSDQSNETIDFIFNLLK